MLKPSLPLDETQRLRSLHSLKILDTPSEDRYDRITRMAKRLFDVDICLVSLVDKDRQWFKSRQGLDACETSREVSFCGHAILNKEPFIVSNAAEDVRFADNPLVTDPPSIRFYAGCPIHSPEGFRIGTLCIIDSKPKVLDQDEIQTLKDFAAMIEDELKVSAQVTVDELTQIANRRGFNTVAGHLLSLCRRTDTSAELLYFDLDGFKTVNDTLGHAAGDYLLEHFAGLLLKCFREADVVGRLGGDEFVVLLGNCAGCSKAALDRLRDMAAEPDCEILSQLDWSVGVVEFIPDRHDSIEALLADADANMFEDKAQRRASGG
jgi:diguanylate cyclase (GGDEF)-like protein